MNDGVIQDFWLNALWSITPTVLAGLIFWLIMRKVFRADRDEREAYAKLEREERKRLGIDEAEAALESHDTTAPDTSSKS